MQEVYKVVFREGEGSGAIGGFYFAQAQLEFGEWLSDTQAEYLAIVPIEMASAFEQAMNEHPDVIIWEKQK